MSARVLVVDDIPVNAKLLEAKLMAEYFEVITALNGHDALKLAEAENPDIVLLDVMMPGLDGYEVCRRLKASESTRHIPVVMVTALDQQSDRVKGIEAGADDFLTKPVDDVELFARIKSLVRVKMMSDELRLRQATGRELGIISCASDNGDDFKNVSLLVVEDRDVYIHQLRESLDSSYDVDFESNPDEALFRIKARDFDLAIVSLGLRARDGLRLCSQIRSMEESRQLPILTLVGPQDRERMVRGLEMGVSDYLSHPIDSNELMARVKAQIRRKRYQDQLREDFHQSVEMAITDQLTSLYNRRYLSSHLANLVQEAQQKDSQISCLILDIDFFKTVNDSYGHDVGDQVLIEFARRISNNIRGMDLACRYGGEEFVIIMPDTDISFAYMVAERLRQEVANVPFQVDADVSQLSLTVSIGITASEQFGDTADAFLKRADQALYTAKRDGRNRVVAAAA